VARRLTTLLASAVLVAGGTGCGSPSSSNGDIPPLPLPTLSLAGRTVSLYPLTMLLPEVALRWDSVLSPHTAALRHADSLIEQAFTQRAPEVQWILPEALRRAARRAPGLLPDPEQLGTAVMRDPRLSRLPDPLRSQLRMLTGAAGDRWAMIPASLLFYRDSTGAGRAELTLVLADVRTGDVAWRSVGKGVADAPWPALHQALETIVPLAR
jgi:hypothetical protein